MATKTYRQLTARQLLDWFVALHPRAFLLQGRDEKLLATLLRESGVTSSQVLEGMVFDDEARSVYDFVHRVGEWLLTDLLLQEAELAVFLSGERPPPCYYDYCDLRDTGVNDARIALALDAARDQLRTFTDERLEQPALSPRHPRIQKLLAVA